MKEQMIAVGYVRRSTDRQEMSLEQQRAKLEQFASARGWKIAKIFCDDAVSGSEMKRPGLESLMSYARASTNVGAVITWERNRISRPKDPVDGLMLERELLAAGKRVLYAATGQEADRSFASGLMSYVENFQNGDYLRKLSRDVSRGIIHRVERGLWPGGPIPFGFDRIVLAPDATPKRIVRDMPDRTQLVMDALTGAELERVGGGHRYSKQDFELLRLIPSEPARVRAVQKAFADYAAGAPIRCVRDGLNAAGLRTARGRIFTAPTIHAMLENRAYVGDCVYNRRTESKWHRLTGGGSQERLDEGLELRPESDWIVKADAWPAIIDRDTFEQVKQRRVRSKDKYIQVTGTAIHSPYLLGGLMFCGVCNGRLVGQTCTSGKGYRTRYYICGTHHRGDHTACPARYKVPADLIETHIVKLIKDDLAGLRDDRQLTRLIESELQRVTGSQDDAGEQLQRRLADLDQQLAKLRDHLKALDYETAAALGLYDDAKALAEERKTVEKDLAGIPTKSAVLPPTATIATNAASAFDELDKVLEVGTIEEKRELLALYVQKIKADPNLHQVEIGLCSSLFTRKVAGGGFEPPTSGL